ncbi:MAG: class I SAM-dependent methyltransferase [Oligoflexia bacterium]|nr:class I SAM-dependent methyltransferase [Oligoflexia bacterium]MBF0365570.1 class I SAM-dependent methyltransferase [Oligoflexia bacterium]
MMIFNRIKKNQKRLAPYLRQEGVDAYRLYDRDIPEYPYIVDVYGEYVVLYERGIATADEVKREQHQKEILVAIEELLLAPAERVVVKRREEGKGGSKYGEEAAAEAILKPRTIITRVHEGLLTFEVNLTDYIDTGLFLDHRPLRKRVLKEVAPAAKVLNLFSYTGALSVAAAKAGGVVVSVDWSKTYQAWAQRNFSLNQISNSSGGHQFVTSDVVAFLTSNQKALKDYFDLIILDPPTFSNSKRQEEVWDVQRDHCQAIELALNLLASTGVLYFSCNKRNFKLDPGLVVKASNISKATLAPDFRDPKIHHCYLLGK